MVALDTASPDRLGMLGASAERAAELIVVDHHRTNPGFGSIVVLDPAASSTAELVFRLIERMGGDGAVRGTVVGLASSCCLCTDNLPDGRGLSNGRTRRRPVFREARKGE